MERLKRSRGAWWTGIACIVLLSVAFSACEKIYDNLEACPHGVSLRFVYDYNMLFSNAFPKEVDCLTLYVYDEEENYVATHVVTEEALLQDEDWRMQLELSEGTYHFVVYGGMACGKRSFGPVSEPDTLSLSTDLRTRLDAECLTDPDRKNLHGFYWGELTLSTADLFREGVVKMMKNTNNIRIVLQDVNGGSEHGDDFTFEIMDDNTLFGPDNDLISAGNVTYTPWRQGDAPIGMVHGNAITGAFAELSTSRLMTKNEPHLVVRNKVSGQDVIDIPLLNYLMLLRSDLYADWDEQEFLDRQSTWEMLFLLDNNRWVRTYIKINDWTVRVNDIQ